MRTWVSGMAACGFHSVWKKLSAQRPEHQAEVVTPALIQDGPRLAEPKCAKRAKRYAPGNRCAVIVRASPAASCRTNLALALMARLPAGFLLTGQVPLRGNPTVEDY